MRAQYQGRVSKLREKQDIEKWFLNLREGHNNENVFLNVREGHIIESRFLNPREVHIIDNRFSDPRERQYRKKVQLLERGSVENRFLIHRKTLSVTGFQVLEG